MGVSKNNGTPKSSILIGFSIINHPFWGKTPIFGNTQIVTKQMKRNVHSSHPMGDFRQDPTSLGPVSIGVSGTAALPGISSEPRLIFPRWGNLVGGNLPKLELEVGEVGEVERGVFFLRILCKWKPAQSIWTWHIHSIIMIYFIASVFIFMNTTYTFMYTRTHIVSNTKDSIRFIGAQWLRCRFQETSGRGWLCCWGPPGTSRW